MTGQVTDRYPLSALQQGMLFHHLQAPNSGAYIQQVVFTLLESVDTLRLQKVWQLLLERHAALRTTFHCLAHEAPMQQVQATVSVPWQDFDWATQEPSSQDVLFSELLTAERLDFDLTIAPLIRLACCRFGPTESRLVWTFHHILADGRSRLLLAQEVFAHYQMLKDEAYLCLPDPVPYSKYINWLEQQDFHQAKTFWKNLLQGYIAPRPLNLGTNGPSVGRNVQEERLSPEITAGLKEFAAQNDLTLNTLVQIAWAFLLSRYSGENDIVFGATRACRKSTVEGSESIIGLLINTVPVRVSIGARDSVLDCLKALRSQWLAVREYEHTPLRLVQAWSAVPAGQSLFETIFVFEHSHLETQLRALGNEWNHRSVQVHQQTHYPLTLEAYGDLSLLLRLEYSQARFDDASMQRMLGHLKNICQEILVRPTKHPSELDLLAPEEKHQLLHQHSLAALKPSSFVDQPSTLHRLFEEQSSRTPDAIAVTCEGISITYRELNARADQLAIHLSQLGVGPEVIVVLYLERSIGLVTSLLAILKASGAYLPIDLAYPTERIAFMLIDAQAPIVITQSALVASLPAMHSRVVCIDGDGQALGTPVPVQK